MVLHPRTPLLRMRFVIFETGGMGRETLRNARLVCLEIVFANDRPSPPVMGVPVI